MTLECVDPGAVQDWELEACADGEALPHVAQHLQRCPACRARVEEHVALEHRLRQALYRCDCLSPDLLRDYHWGYLSPDESQQVEAHLDTCPHCVAELDGLAGWVAAKRVHPLHTLLNRARQAADQVGLVVAQLLSPRLSLVPALRGERRDVLLFDAEGVAVSVNLEQEDTGLYTLCGQVLSPEPVALTDGYARLTAREEGGDPVQASLDANGGFTLSDLHSGIYQLVVCLPDRRIVVPTLALNAEP